MNIIVNKFKKIFFIPKKDLLLFTFVSISIAFVDLLTKSIVFSMKNSALYVMKFLNILKVKNYGITFGLFDDSGSFIKIGILVFDIIVMLYILTLIKTKSNYTKPFIFIASLSFVFGGAIGNFLDRIYYGFVRDFIDIHLQNYHWACFNIADSFICIGCGLWVINEMFLRKNKTFSTKKY